MSLQPILDKDELFTINDVENIWRKYCGFLDLTVDEFMIIQESLLTEQMELAASSELGQKIMRGQKPGSLYQFRRDIPFTTYDDYQPYLHEHADGVLSKKPVVWAHTSGTTGTAKWVPYFVETIDRLAHDILAAFILSSASRKGEVRLREGAKVVLNLPPPPYVSGIMGHAAMQRIAYQPIPPLEAAEEMDFEARIRQGFETALYTGIDYAGSMAAVLAKVGESFSHLSVGKLSSVSWWHPMALLRLASGLLKSRLLNRPMLPRDIWRVKGLVCGGTDTSIYRDQIYHYWGVQPLDVYVSTETCFIAMQGWNKRDMTFVPYTNFYEFIPEAEWVRSREDRSYQPRTVLLNEVEAGNIYELVVTNFRGGPFLRYRIGDLIKITALNDTGAGVMLPQMSFQSRNDDIIDIAGFSRLDEKTVWRAIQAAGLSPVDWSARKECVQGQPMLHIYLELPEYHLSSKELAALIDKQLTVLDEGYHDLKQMTGAGPVSVTFLASGAFGRYRRAKAAAGLDLARLKPPHMNADDSVINELITGGRPPVS